LRTLETESASYKEESEELKARVEVAESELRVCRAQSLAAMEALADHQASSSSSSSSLKSGNNMSGNASGSDSDGGLAVQHLLKDFLSASRDQFHPSSSKGFGQEQSLQQDQEVFLKRVCLFFCNMSMS
jgi:hypothetical protein